MTALMGSSGAGKTTLLDVLAGRKTSGTVSGDVRLNGHPKIQKTFTRRVDGLLDQWIDQLINCRALTDPRRISPLS